MGAEMRRVDGEEGEEDREEKANPIADVDVDGAGVAIESKEAMEMSFQESRMLRVRGGGVQHLFGTMTDIDRVGVANEERGQEEGPGAG
jgi:hypothetical protein